MAYEIEQEALLHGRRRRWVNDNTRALLDGRFWQDEDLQRTSYGVYISQLIRFARAFSNVSDFNSRNKALTTKLLK